MTKEEFGIVFPWLLKEELRKKQITATSFARQIEIERYKVYAWVNGKRIPTYEELALIANALECDIDIFTDVDVITVEKIKIRIRAHELEEIDNAKNGRMPRKIRVIETGEIFENVEECADWLMVKKRTVSSYIRHGIKTHYGYHLEYFTDKYGNQIGE